MSTIASAAGRRSVLRRRIRLLVAATITYNVIEAIVAIAAGTVAGSVALIGFGLDSVIEVTSAADRVGPTSLRVHLPAGDEVVTTVQDLIARETGCCSFFTFTVRPSAIGTELEVGVPASQTAVLDAMQHRAESARAARLKGARR